MDVKLVARGTPGFSGAELANLVNIAALKAAIEGHTQVTKANLDYAVDRIIMGNSFLSLMENVTYLTYKKRYIKETPRLHKKR